MNNAQPPLVLIILDGFGYSADSSFNAIAAANAPEWHSLWDNSPRTLIHTSGLAVGLPEGQMGNSEVGHMTLGAGRVVYQNLTRINKAIAEGDFFSNPVYVSAIDRAVAAGKAVHIMGLLSEGGVHSHENHLLAMIDMAAQRHAGKIYVHVFLDGRDVPPRSAEPSLQRLEDKLHHLGVGQIASVSGRFYALDRDGRWDRVQAAYDAITAGRTEFTALTAIDALHAAYGRDENDEFVQPTAVVAAGESFPVMEDGDATIFMNFRPDRARQITRAFVEEDFKDFQRSRFPQLVDFVMTTEYSADIKTSCAFPPEDMVNSFGEYISKHGKTQLRIAETEKYAHVTFFFSGGQEEAYPGEDRILVPSPKVATYDLQPEMSAYEVTDKLVEAINSGQYDAIICNYANCDQVGHTGVYDAAVKAVEVVDKCLGRVLAALKKVDGEALITADHGNVEEMYDRENDQPHTQHTTLPVPLCYVGSRDLTLKEGGSLADIAPTMLTLLDLQQPAEMTGRSLISTE